MKASSLRKLSLSCLLFLFTLSSVQAALTLRLKNGVDVNLYSKSYALVIGVSKYDKWIDLPGVKEDVKHVKSSLVKHGFNVTTLEDPTRSEFDNAVRNFIADYGQDANNRLLFYFAGHGHTLKTRLGRQLGYIVPSDAPSALDKSSAFKKKAISMLEIEIYARQMESKHALFVFDSCFSGSLFALSRAAPPSISTKLALPVRQFITSGSAEQEVPDSGMFRRQFVSALDGAGDINKDGYITGSELALYLEEKVTNMSQATQTPQYGKIRDPILDKGDVVFMRPGFDPSTVKVDEKAIIAAELAEKQALIAQLQAEQERLATLKAKSGLKKLSGPRNKVVIVTHGQANPHGDGTDEEHTFKISSELKNATKEYVKAGTNIIEIKDHGVGKSLLYDDKEENSYSLELCQSNSADLLIAGLIDEDMMNGGAQGAEPRRINYYIFDCNKKTGNGFSIYLDEHRNDSFYQQHDISKKYKQFIEKYIEDGNA